MLANAEVQQKIILGQMMIPVCFENQQGDMDGLWRVCADVGHLAAQI
jgi:hypothetical protein